MSANELQTVATIRYPGGMLRLDENGVWHGDREHQARTANQVAGPDCVTPADGNPLVAQARKLNAILKGELLITLSPPTMDEEVIS